MKNTINCPLCNSTLKYKKTWQTHIWSCPECPFIGFEFHSEQDTINLKLYLNKKIPHCIYCDKKRPSKHFCCDLCGVGMCNNCYNNMTEHDGHYHEICENADPKEYDLIVKKIGHEPAYLCEECLKKILKPIKQNHNQNENL